MPGKIEWTNRAVKDIGEVNPKDRASIIQALDTLLETRQGDILKLHGATREWRLWVGDWRVRFSFLDNGNILILRVLDRREAY
ncbi:MAG: type II toxin-antitoxin system RelE/ParE family toxin [Chloroflexi bacterium]|nr:type II toxin-antitoxin system RelE/ParE family toxin [Chloroflexota bacterium]